MDQTVWDLNSGRYKIFLFLKSSRTSLIPIQKSTLWDPRRKVARGMMFHSFIPLSCAECDDSLPFSGTSSIPLSYLLFPATLLHQLFFHPLSSHLVIYFLVYLSILLFPNLYIIPFWEFYFLPFSVHARTNIVYLTLLSLGHDADHLNCH